MRVGDVFWESVLGMCFWNAFWDCVLGVRAEDVFWECVLGMYFGNACSR